MKKLICMMLALMTLLFGATAFASETPEIPDLFRFVPTRIIIDGENAKVEGYFINMSDTDISGVENLEMLICYQNETIIPQASFDGENLRNMNLRAGRMECWTFNWRGCQSNLKDGVYVVDSDCFASFSCTIHY